MKIKVLNDCTVYEYSRYSTRASKRKLRAGKTLNVIALDCDRVFAKCVGGIIKIHLDDCCILNT